MKILENYKSSLLLLGGMLLGGIAGYILGPKVEIIKPVATLFLNLLFCIAVPMVFISVTASIANLHNGKEAGSLLGWTFIFFIGSIIVASILFTFIFGFLDAAKGATLPSEIISAATQDIKIDILGQLTVSDFWQLWSIQKLLAIVVFALICGFSLRTIGDKGKILLEVVNSLNEMITKFINTIMKFAPIGLGAYFAVFIGTSGGGTAGPMMKIAAATWISSFIYIIVIHSFYSFLANGINGIKSFWKSMITPFLTALGTCSGAASVPVNIEAAKIAKIDDKVASIVMPLGCNLHKEGTAIMVAMTVSFECAMLGLDFFTPQILGTCILMGIIYPFVAGAIPTGAPFLLFSVFGWPMETFAAVMALHTITDAPTTTVNVVSNLSIGQLVEKMLKKNKKIKY